MSAFHPGSAGDYRFHDVLITGAAAQIAIELCAHRVLVWIRMLFNQLKRIHHHARRAKAALQTVMLAKRGLHRVQVAVGAADTLDGGDVHALRLHGENIARFNRTAIQMHGAGAALAGVAADVRAG